MKRIFISYSRKDASVVDSICEILPIEEVEVFIDRDGIHGAEDFVTRIAEEISRADLMLFIASQNAYESKYVKKELLYAMDKGKTILPYRIDDSPMPDAVSLLLGDINHLSIRTHPVNAELGREIIMAAEGKLVGPTKLLTKKRPISDRIIVFIVVIVATLAIIVIAGKVKTIVVDANIDKQVQRVTRNAHNVFKHCDSLHVLAMPESTADNEIDLLLGLDLETRRLDSLLKFASTSSDAPQSIEDIKAEIWNRLDSINGVWKEQARIALTLYNKTQIEQEHSFAEEYVRIAGKIKKDKEWEILHDAL